MNLRDRRGELKIWVLGLRVGERRGDGMKPNSMP
jgi:hypothetical protein